MEAWVNDSIYISLRNFVKPRISSNISETATSTLCYFSVGSLQQNRSGLERRFNLPFHSKSRVLDSSSALQNRGQKHTQRQVLQRTYQHFSQWDPAQTRYLIFKQERASSKQSEKSEKREPEISLRNLTTSFSDLQGKLNGSKSSVLYWRWITLLKKPWFLSEWTDSESKLHWL